MARRKTAARSSRAGRRRAKSAAPRRSARARSTKRSAAKARRTRRLAGKSSRRPARRVAKARRAPRKAARVTRRSAARATRRSTAKGSRPATPARKPSPKGPATPLPALASAPLPPARARRSKAPSLDRVRRQLPEEIVPGPPSSLTFESHASAAQTGRAELIERLNEHTATSPRLTAGDIDANWEEAYSSGDEAPGGDNPTPDQDVVDEIGRALGVEYADNEELKSADKIAGRDRHRWEFDPASAEDYRDRVRDTDEG
jgi:hypothetical protein